MRRLWIALLLVDCGSTDLGVMSRDAATPLVVDAESRPDLGADAAPPADLRPDAAVPDALAIADAPAPDAPADSPAPPLDRAPDSSCGHTDLACCPDLTCVDPDTVCVGSDPDTALCKRCGRNEANPQPCCAGNRCFDGNCCVHLQSGNIGPFCIRPGGACFDIASRCGPTGSCGPNCGGVDQPCCQAPGAPYCSASGTACMRAPGAMTPSCVACGQAGQPCCQQVRSQFSIEPCGDGLRCLGDRCG